MTHGETQEPMVLIIRSEEEAWAALERAVSGAGFPDDLQLRFDGWPTFELGFAGRDWHSTVPTRIMPPLLDVQKDINRAYAHIRYGEFNLRRLKEEEREELEVVVEVKDGSSVFSANLWDHFTRIAETAIGRMSGDQAVIVVLGLALAIVAPVMYKAWLASRERQRETESRVELSRQETERMKIMAEAMRHHPPLRSISEDVEMTTNRLLKAARPGDTVELKGIPLSAEEAGQLVQAERERAREVELAGAFMILGNRTDKGDGFRITVKRVSDDLQLSADVPPDLNWDQKQAIQAAEWSKKAVYLEISAEMLRESVTRAEVISARPVAD